MGGVAVRSSAAARRSVAALTNHAFVSATRAGSCGMEQPALAQHRTGQRGAEMTPGKKLAVRAHEGVHGGPRAPKHLVGESTPPTFRRGIVRDHDQEIIVAVGTGVAARDGT